MVMYMLLPNPPSPFFDTLLLGLLSCHRFPLSCCAVYKIGLPAAPMHVLPAPCRALAAAPQSDRPFVIPLAPLPAIWLGSVALSRCWPAAVCSFRSTRRPEGLLFGFHKGQFQPFFVNNVLHTVSRPFRILSLFMYPI